MSSYSNRTILIAGIISLIVAIGLARFSFTSLLESMLFDRLTPQQTGYLASMNYIGYLSGALMSVFVKDLVRKIRLFQLGMLTSIVTTFLLGVIEDISLWYLLRLLAGFGTALVVVVGGAIVMLQLNMKDKTKAMGIHFSGIGIAIAITEIVSQLFLLQHSWQITWIYLGIFAIPLSLYAVPVLSEGLKHKDKIRKHPLALNIFTPYVRLLLFGYFSAGVGFVIQATYLPDIINSLDGLQGYGSLGWLIVGVVGAPMSILSMRLAHRYGSINMIIIVSFFQIIGILIPTFSHAVWLNLLSAALYGATFISHVALFMHYGGKISEKNPVVLMGALTAVYSVGQVSAPLYSVYFYNQYQNYNATLYMTACIVFLGLMAMLYAKRLKQG